MSATVRRATDPVRASWSRFWFEPVPTSSLALFRIAFGVVATAWTVTLAPNLTAFYGPHGVQAPASNAWSVLALSNSTALLFTVFAVTICASVAVTVGLYTRAAAVLLWVGIQSFIASDVLITNSGDGLIRDLAFFCALAPAGTALSVDRLRAAPEQFWECPTRPAWSLRLIQIQLSVGYLAAVWHKAHSDVWTNGTAVAYALRMDDVHRLPTPGFVTHSLVLTNLLTYGSLATELALGVLVWNRVARPWVLAAGVSLHLGIDASLVVGFFSYAVLAGYLAFISPEAAATRVVAMGRRLHSIPARTEWTSGTVQTPSPHQPPRYARRRRSPPLDILSPPGSIRPMNNPLLGHRRRRNLTSGRASRRSSLVRWRQERPDLNPHLTSHPPSTDARNDGRTGWTGKLRKDCLLPPSSTTR